MWGRAEQQAGAGAGVLFARLDVPDGRRAESIAVLQRLIARLRAGEWSDELAEVVARALAADCAPCRPLLQQQPAPTVPAPAPPFL